MKKISALLIASVIAGTTTWAAGPAPVYSVNAVGLVKKTVPPTSLIMCGINFNAMVTNDINTVFAGQLTGALDSGSSDVIIKWDATAQQYVAAWKVDGSGFAEYDGKWFADDGAFPPNPSPITFAPGDGFWVRNNHSFTQTVTFAGEVPTAATITNVVKSQLNLLSYPYSAATSVNDPTNLLSTVAVGALDSGSSDILILWNVAAQQYVSLWIVGGSGTEFDGFWYYDDGAFPPNLANETLSVGDGFWLRRQRTGQVLWMPAKPYSL